MLRIALLALLAAAPAAAQNVTLSFRDAPLGDVVATFAGFSGTSIVLGAGTAGRVTAEIRDQPWQTALAAIAGAHGLAIHAVAPGLLRIDAAERAVAAEAEVPLVTRVFRLRYLPAVDAARTLQGLASERGRVAASEHSNAVVVTDTADRIDVMARVLGHAPWNGAERGRR
jgi:type II secretory pathway component GspD/PulD (secretin)